LHAHVKWLGHYNPAASTHGPIPYFFSSFAGDNLVRNPSYISMLESNADNQSIYDFGDGKVPVGDSDFGQVKRAVVFEGPEGALEHYHSIGQLMHAQLYRWNLAEEEPAADNTRLRDRNNYTRFDNLKPAYAIGNSLADPHIP